MSYQENDISWQVLRGIVQEWGGVATELAEVTPLDGGSISTTLRLVTRDSRQAVLKISPYRVDRSYENEAQNLNLLGSLGLPVPVVYRSVVGTLDNPNSYLLMEFVEGVDLNEARRRCSSEEFDDLQRQLAEWVARMHGCTGPCHGRVTAAGLVEFANWPTFFRAIHESTWLESKALQAIPIKARKVMGKVHDRLEQLIGRGERPRLVHSDLWASNLLCAPDGCGRWRIAAVLDPACKYADAETEIAYLDLFHTSTPVFNKAYQQHFKLDETYHRVRKPIYQLYYLLNHVCLFGTDYLKPLMTTIERLGAIV